MRLIAASLFVPALLLCGCSLSPTATPTPEPGVVIQGNVHGGQQPVVGAKIFLLAASNVGNDGDGIPGNFNNLSTTLLTSGDGFGFLGYYVLTDANGSFRITGDYTCIPGQQVYLYAQGGNPGAGVNNAATFLAVVGQCPSTMTFPSTQFVWMNEVTTVAAAYALAGYATDAVHVSSNNNTLALTGIRNAFATASNLVDLSNGTARSTTPAGNGIVPQATINTLANILAACVNASDVHPGQCTTLFAAATDDGTSTGVKPVDMASAAVNIAHHPVSNVSTLYAIPAPAQAFAPSLSAQPTSFCLALSFSQVDAPSAFISALAIDGEGNVWTGNQQGGGVERFSNLGAHDLTVAGAANFLAIDGQGNAWFGNESSSSLTKVFASGLTTQTVTPGSQLQNPYGIAIDGSDRIWIANDYATVVVLSNSGAPVTGSPFFVGNRYSGYGVAFDGSGNAWLPSYDVPGELYELSKSGVVAPNVPYTGGGLNAPVAVALDASGYAWVGNFGSTNVVSRFSNTGVPTPANGFAIPGLEHPNAVAIDGSGHVWLGSVASSLLELSNSGSVLSGSSGFDEITNAREVAIDASGNVWTATDHQFYEYVGLATPVVTPLATGVKNNAVGARP